MRKTNEEWCATWKVAKRKTDKDRALMGILHNNKGLINTHARKIRNFVSNKEDFNQHCIPYTIYALNNFDLSRGLKFTSYYVWVLKACVSTFNKEEGIVKPVFRKEGTKTKIVHWEEYSLNKIDVKGFEPINSLEAEPEPEKQEGSAYVPQLLESLTERELKLITEYYGIGPTKVPKTLEETRRYSGLTREMTRQIVAGARKKMRGIIKQGVIANNPFYKEITDIYEVYS